MFYNRENKDKNERKYYKNIKGYSIFIFQLIFSLKFRVELNMRAKYWNI